MISEPKALPRLTRLELHGFKSFANRTAFVFEPGITAVIGPNGSGKSNISDGVRWVLGEQSHSLLRSKKTEDVIFAGGNGRAPGGFAEVTVTFDNATGWLPIEFAEVTVTRRALRSGENQFLINGRKVRLKDVHQLTASLGQSYTVVGQGLVDTALSQRAEERRGLFEHAADLTGLQLKAGEAERNLNDARNNADRIADLLAEVEPRLRTLERAARQAREWQGVHDRLKTIERGYFHMVLLDVRGRVARAEAANQMETSRLSGAQTAVDAAGEQLEDARELAATTQSALARQSAHLRSMSERAQQLAHERDLAAERIAAIDRRREDLIEGQRGLEERAADLEREIGQVQRVIEELSVSGELTGVAIPELERDVQKAREGRQARERQRQQLASAVADLERRAVDIERALQTGAERLETLNADRVRQQSQTAEHSERVLQLRQELDAVEIEIAATSETLQTCRERQTALAAQIADKGGEETSKRKGLSTLQEERSRTRAQLDALERIHESGVGLYAGVRAVLTAGKAGKLGGIEGTVAELISLPAQYETAIEVALGAHLQDIVVRSWSNAEAAIGHLKATRAGRATFQPLDTVRTGNSNKPRELDGMPGVHGIAASLVTFAPEHRIIADALLGRTVVVDDLPAARQALRSLPGGWTTVTLGGEIARSGGSVTGGSAVRENGMLTRERELRELPATIQRLVNEIEAATAALEAATTALASTQADARQTDRERVELEARLRELGNQQRRLAGWLQEQEARQGSETGRQQEAAGRIDALETDRARLQQARAELDPALEQARQSHQRTVDELDRDAQRLRELEQRLTAALQERAVLDERFRAERRQLASLLAQQETVSEQLTQRLERASGFEGERSEIGRQLEELEIAATAGEVERQRLAEAQAPAETAMREAAARVAECEQTLEGARQRLMQIERERGSATVVLERHRGELATLRQRIADDLELDDPEELLNQPVEELDLDLIEAEREIARLKERLRRVGYIGDEAVQEFERESERHRFLSTQLEDVLTASASLRELLEDLRGTMQQRFEETFKRVAEEFSAAFTILFGGGTARLILIDNEEGGPSGVDIVAQPPGKRLQSLALLSGGERALTAAALLFAILKVNPSPFVLLDEVDAALDEANVVRFRERLQQLANETQAIIITHNRGTIEVADSLYGISMREDGVSTVLSMRMAGELVG
ncbi:MAG TPA: chromosome segregation protein SMC [Thermomicrobiales bacterium]|nr:chromosome segregation protein SMC [Thermomicrobiales bacterium]